jgi:hypothetical protein
VLQPSASVAKSLAKAHHLALSCSEVYDSMVCRVEHFVITEAIVIIFFFLHLGATA